MFFFFNIPFKVTNLYANFMVTHSTVLRKKSLSLAMKCFQLYLIFQIADVLQMLIHITGTEHKQKWVTVILGLSPINTAVRVGTVPVFLPV